MSNPTFIASIIISLLSGLLASIVVHILTAWNERKKERRDQRIEFLISAYRKLSDVANRENRSLEQTQGLEEALSDIMLLGEQEEIEAARQFMLQISSSQNREGGDLKKVIIALRNSLRKQLGLSELNVTDDLLLLRMSS
ncbi:hypothetical protein [Rothia nasisuis]|uniref:hypothetical protein n=1 Tax=Rothia nasisuis TaxID=2109647 RepID=UPI001F3B958D|nr:hypothetical protein [Rothia nasisuis]